MSFIDLIINFSHNLFTTNNALKTSEKRSLLPFVKQSNSLIFEKNGENSDD